MTRAAPTTREAVFRCDFGPGIGGGHLKRSVNLARALVRRGWRCRFVVNAADADTDLQTGPWEIVSSEGPVACAALERTVRAVRSAPPPLAVLDHPATTQEDERTVATWGARPLSFLDQPDRDVAAVAVIAPGLAATPSAFEPIARAADAIMAGAGFAPLDPAYRTAAANRAGRRRGDPPRVFVSFGLADPGGAALQALRAIFALERPVDVDLALGPFGRAGDLPPVPPGIRLRVHRGLAEVSQLLASADLAVGAAGTACIERCVLGIPSVVVPISDNQEDTATYLQAAGAAQVVRGPVAALPDALAKPIAHLLADPAARGRLGQAAAGLADPFGADRIAANLCDTQDRCGRRVLLRRAGWSDAEMLHAWQLDPDTRRFAHTPDPPSRDDHLRWFNDRLADRNCCFNLVEAAGRAAGYLRLDRIESAGMEAWKISVATAPERRGEGIGLAALRLARMLISDDPLVAEVFDANLASRRLFEAAGFRRAGGVYTHRPESSGVVKSSA